jgi:hypothetical protein
MSTMVIFHLKFLTLIKLLFSLLQVDRGRGHSEYLDPALWTQGLRLAASKTLPVISYNHVFSFMHA